MFPFLSLKFERHWLPVAVMPGKARLRALRQPMAFLFLDKKSRAVLDPANAL